MTSSNARHRSTSDAIDGQPVIRIPMDAETSATVAVVRAVAEAEGANPGELPLLSDVIDPEAFDAMFDDDRVGRSGVRFSFDYCGYVVTITDDAVTLDIR